MVLLSCYSGKFEIATGDVAEFPFSSSGGGVFCFKYVLCNEIDLIAVMK